MTFSTRSKIFTGARGAFFRFRLQTQRTDVKPVLNTYFSRRSYASSGFLGSNSFAFLLYPLGNPLQRVHWGTTGVGLVLLNGPTLSPRCLEQTTFDIPRPSLEQTKHWNIKNYEEKNKTNRLLVEKILFHFQISKKQFFNIEKTNESNLNSQKHSFYKYYISWTF